MKKILEHRDFSSFSTKTLKEAVGNNKTKVFLSHKHDDLSKLYNIICFLEYEYNVRVYIDSKDPSMPESTSGETAERIKKSIEACGKFIFFATDGAIESKWCNWELGYGDAKKGSQKNIALFPMKENGTYDSSYKGNEYMSIYPYICYYEGSETYTNGRRIEKGYYVRTESSGGNFIQPLSEWLGK